MFHYLTDGFHGTVFFVSAHRGRPYASVPLGIVPCEHDRWMDATRWLATYLLDTTAPDVYRGEILAVIAITKKNNPNGAYSVPGGTFFFHDVIDGSLLYSMDFGSPDGVPVVVFHPAYEVVFSGARYAHRSFYESRIARSAREIAGSVCSLLSVRGQQAYGTRELFMSLATRYADDYADDLLARADYADSDDDGDPWMQDAADRGVLTQPSVGNERD